MVLLAALVWLAIYARSGNYYWEAVDSDRCWVAIEVEDSQLSIYVLTYNFDGSEPYLQHSLRLGAVFQRNMLQRGFNPADLTTLRGPVHTYAADNGLEPKSRMLGTPAPNSTVRFAAVSIPHLISALLLLLILGGWLFFGKVIVEAARSLRGRCAGCGYDLIGNVSGQCPECGKVVGSQRMKDSS